MAVVVEGNQLVSVVNPEDGAGAKHEKPDAQYAAE